LSACAKYNKLEILNILTRHHNINIYYDNDTALKESIINKNTHVVEILLNYYTPQYIIQNGYHANEIVSECLVEYLIYRRRLIKIQRLVLDILWRPNGYFCKKGFQTIKNLNYLGETQ
jgi:hypothetical protein